jgi:hypothetical protein
MAVVEAIRDCTSNWMLNEESQKSGWKAETSTESSVVYLWSLFLQHAHVLEHDVNDLIAVLQPLRCDPHVDAEVGEAVLGAHLTARQV